MGDGCLFRLLVRVSSAVHLGRTVCFTTGRSYHQEKQLARTELETMVMYREYGNVERGTSFHLGRDGERAGDVVKGKTAAKKKKSVESRREQPSSGCLSVEGGRGRREEEEEEEDEEEEEGEEDEATAMKR
ncbi:hypothetical protein TRV_06824 [Trichophyton verrucosum HKI 0517]|uniref:Uncharacterized protein n=1 Tax=Trichophyton verrucosum (strain HKI 0517) TaxID=663202 RepID=D4DI17_TRIVH|nr:uncharacterized protein TRV_06824 [Trichophyton verrucosum HKI 0517]EFE38495.1 hypothetical protein TRV_06824 [Trichophyton verrucosum HKI 0517]